MGLISRLRNILRLPLPVPTWRQLIVESVFLGVFVAIFIIVFQPFGTYEYQIPYKTQRLLGYGLVVFGSYLPLKKGLTILFKSIDYSLWQELLVLLITFLLTAIICFFYFKLVAYPGATWQDLDDFLIFCFAIGFLPLTITLYTRYSEGLHLANTVKSASGETTSEKKVLTLAGTNQEAPYRFHERDILYLKSSGNYVEVHFIKDGAVRSVLLRSTLNQALAQLPEHVFGTVHRSYVINKGHFSRLTRSSGKGTLFADKWSLEVPVSRTNLAFAEQIVRDFR